MDKQEAIAQYMVTELELLVQSALQYKQQIISKVNFFLAIVTASMGGLFLVSDQSSLLQPYLLAISCVVLALLLLIGIAVLSQVLELVAMKRIAYRRGGRIRRWFLTLDSTIQPYLPYPASDEFPRLYAPEVPLRGVEALLLVLIAALASAMSGLMAFVFCQWAKLGCLLFNVWTVPVLVAVAVFLASWVIQDRYIRRYFQKMEAVEKSLGRVHFPERENFSESDERLNKS